MDRQQATTHADHRPPRAGSQLWRTDGAEVVLQLFQRTFAKESWPALQLPADESVVAHANPNVINFYDPADPSAGPQRLLLSQWSDASFPRALLASRRLV